MLMRCKDWFFQIVITCDPVTGSWSERLLSFEEYKLLYHTNGFSLSIKNGFYNTHQSNFLKKTAVLFVNTLSKFFPVLGKRFSPFITLIGKKEV
jgi:hypothetical protein